MKQRATVLDKNGEEIIVGCDKSSCESCHASMFCTNKDNSFGVINPNNIEIDKGDKVELDMPTGKTIKSIFLSLGLPLIMFLPGYFIGKLFTSNELLLLVWAIAFMALGFLFSGLYFRKRKKEYSPSILSKVDKDEE